LLRPPPKLREEFGRQIEQLRDELSGKIDEIANESAANVALIHSQGEKLKAELEKIVARRRRARTAKPNGELYSGDPLLLPPPLADASLAPGANGNGDGRS
jgi:hypothetical protein